MATKKSGGSSRNGRDSKGRRLGLKKFEGNRVISGQILVRQRGTKTLAGNNVGIGKDHTLYALKAGIVKYSSCIKRRKEKKVCHVVNLQQNDIVTYI